MEKLGIRVNAEKSELVFRLTELHIIGVSMIPKIAHFVS